MQSISLNYTSSARKVVVHRSEFIMQRRVLPTMFRELRRVLKENGSVCIVTESHSQIEGRFYNRYFPSLADNEKRRYPDDHVIVYRAKEAGFCLDASEVLSSSTREDSKEFLRNVAEKNWSMFRLLSDREFTAGFAALSADLGCNFEPLGGGETLLWFRITAR